MFRIHSNGKISMFGEFKDNFASVVMEEDFFKAKKLYDDVDGDKIGKIALLYRYLLYMVVPDTFEFVNKMFKLIK